MECAVRNPKHHCSLVTLPCQPTSLPFPFRFSYYLKGRVTEIRRSISSILPVHLSHDHNQLWSWAGAKPGASSGLLCRCGGSSTWVICCCFPRHVSWELEPMWSSRDSNQHPYGIVVPQAEEACCAFVSIPLSSHLELNATS